jgi:type I restriction enzyme, S subunit
VSWRATTVNRAAEVILGRQRNPESHNGPYMVPYLRAANVKDGVLDLSDVKSMSFSPSEQETFSLASGDVLVTEGSGSIRAVGASAVWRSEIDGRVCFQNTLLRMRPRRGVDPRFLGWWARAAYANSEFASIAAGANIFHLSAERVRALPIYLPPEPEQRRIASFLETETARIDSLIAARRTQIRLLDELRERQRENLLGTGSSLRTINLMHLTDPYRPIVYGIVQAGPHDPGGVPYIKTGDLPDIDPSALSRTSHDIHRQFYRARVRPGDLVMAMRASIGAVGRIPDNLTEANLTQGTARIAPSEDVSVEWLYEALKTSSVRGQCIRSSVGSTFQTLNIWDLRRIQLPAIPRAEQDKAVREFRACTKTSQQLVARLGEQIAKLGERRQAVITAAVTGQIEPFRVTSCDVA